MNRRYGDYGFSKAEREYLTPPDNELKEKYDEETFDERQWTKVIFDVYKKCC